MERTYTGEQMVEEWIETTGRQQTREAAIGKWEDDMVAYNLAVATYYITGAFPTCPEYPF